jgi:hypothetical protein
MDNQFFHLFIRNNFQWIKRMYLSIFSLFSTTNDMIHKQVKNLNIWKIYLVVYVHH